jgi:tripartite-type tricarboxylate transporter receptor subunit TctC
MAGELFKLAAQVNMQFVPYKGEGPAVSDALGGHIQLVFSNLPVALPLAREGKLRGIAVTSAQRVPTAPEFPTASESGLPGFDAFSWFGLFAPAATPRDIVVKLNAEAVRGLNAPDTKEKMAAQMFRPAGRRVRPVREEGNRALEQIVKKRASSGMIRVLSATGMLGSGFREER